MLEDIKIIEMPEHFELSVYFNGGVVKVNFHKDISTSQLCLMLKELTLRIEKTIR